MFFSKVLQRWKKPPASPRQRAELATDLTELYQLLEDRDSLVRTIITARDGLPTDIYDRGAYDPSWSVRHAAATQPLSEPAWQKLAEDAEPTILAVLVCNPVINTVLRTILLTQLVKDGCHVEGQHILALPSVTTELLELCAGLTTQTAIAVIQHESCTRELACRLAKRPNSVISQVVAARFADDPLVLDACLDPFIEESVNEGSGSTVTLTEMGQNSIATLSSLVLQPAFSTESLDRLPASWVHDLAPLRLLGDTDPELAAVLGVLAEGNDRPLGEVRRAAQLLLSPAS